MSKYRINIEKETLLNKNYRKVLFTTPDIQVVVMSLLPYEEIGMEKHNGSQFIRIESGNGTAYVSGKRFLLYNGIAIVIPPNHLHNIIAGKGGLKIYTIYSPPEHKKKTIQREKSS